MSPKELGLAVRNARKGMGATQRQLALAAGTGLRFVVDLEKGKPTCEVGKVLAVLEALGVRVRLEAPKSG